MARIRYIKPGFFKDEDLCELGPWHRLCYAGLWGQGDREGRMEYRPKLLQVEIFPYDRDVEIVPLIDDLVANGFILRYTVDGRTYLAIRPKQWKKHQRPRKDEPASEIPPPPDAGLPRSAAVAPLQRPAPVTSETPLLTAAETSPSLHSDGSAAAEWIGMGRGIGMGNGEGVPAAPAPAPPPAAGPPMARIATGPHKNHAHCGPVCVPAFIHRDFVKHLRGDEAEADRRLRAWYLEVDAVWADKPVGDKPEAFWWARFRELVGTTTETHSAPPPAPDVPPVWAAILERLEVGLERRVVNEWFRPLKVASETGDDLVLAVPRREHLAFIERHYRRDLAQACEQVRPGLTVRMVVGQQRGVA